jgi:hypothetical protein
VVNIGIAGDEDDVALGPAAGGHFRAGHGEGRGGHGRGFRVQGYSWLNHNLNINRNLLSGRDTK